MLGWKGVNELVSNGLERMDERDRSAGEEKAARRGRTREEGQGGMCVLFDFVEYPYARDGEERSGELVEKIIECNFR